MCRIIPLSRIRIRSAQLRQQRSWCRSWERAPGHRGCWGQQRRSQPAEPGSSALPCTGRSSSSSQFLLRFTDMYEYPDESISCYGYSIPLFDGFFNPNLGTHWNFIVLHHFQLLYLYKNSLQNVYICTEKKTFAIKYLFLQASAYSPHAPEPP